MSETRLITIRDLEAKVTRIFEISGIRAETAAAMARVIVAGERDNCKSHGIYRIEGCLRVLRAGKVVPDAVPTLNDTGGPILQVHAGGGFACPAFEDGKDLLIDKARRFGMGAMVIRDCLHFSALWYEVEELASQGLAALSMCPSYSSVAPAGGTTALLGTNPMAFGYPRPGDHPYVFDFATSVVARGEIELHRRAGKPIPEGWAIDSEGQPTTDPEAALAGAMLPFGAHKGSAISTMIELLAGAMLGEFMSAEARDFIGGTTFLPRHGALILAFDPDKFSAGSGRDPVAEGETLLRSIEGQGARLPSQRRFAARSLSEQQGIALTAAEFEMLDRFEAQGLAAVDL
ncbi:Ldh family oxidoreductase [Rubellimicrobium arenae]|uniref:Ldh family oxidoreductase n=1 Tax=Rubellimicrobium arenae TaxID=2817372 RepID=UPI001B30195B|nr:Ldh family oxidoreductase [Rubellimicrobium arenae]